MPELCFYTITQEREVKVWAESLLEAGQIAAAAFAGEIKKGDIAETHIRSPIRELDLRVREDY